MMWRKSHSRFSDSFGVDLSSIWGVGLSLALALSALAVLWVFGLGLPQPAVRAAAAPALGPVGEAALQPTAIITVCPSGCDFDVIQDAVDAAIPGDEIRVAAGLYQGVGNPLVHISKTVTIRGGYSGDFGEWDPELYPTTLDAQELGRVVYVDAAITVTLEGLDLINGGNSDRGGGVYAIGAHLVISACRVYSNTADSYGGGICLQSSDGQIIANDVWGNTALWGGGVALYFSHAIVRLNTIHDNLAQQDNSGDGGGLYLRRSGGVIRENWIYSNTAEARGAGVFLYDSDDTNIVSNEICDNQAGSGGGIYLSGSDAQITSNRIYSNLSSAGGGGSGLYVAQSAPLIEANYIYDNWTGYVGSGMLLYQSTGVTLTNNIMADNQAAGYEQIWANDVFATNNSDGLLIHNTFGNGQTMIEESVVVSESSDLVLINSIVVSHDLSLRVISGTIRAEHSLWDGQGSFSQGPVTWTDRIVGSPAFTSTNCALPSNRCYHISADSDAIDMAINAGIDVDIDGDLRGEGGIDLGADEFQLIAGVSLSPGYVRDGYHGQVLPVGHVLGNTGNGPDTYSIDALSADRGWALDHPGQVSLNHGDVGPLMISVTIPTGVLSGTQDTLIVTATSWAAPEVTAVATDTLLVRLSPQMSLSPGDSRLADVETWVTYTHVLTNQANGSDTVDIQCSNGWGTATCPASMSLGYQASEEIDVVVQVPQGVGGLSDVTQLLVSSRYDPLVQVSAEDTTTARHVPGLALQPGQDGRVDPAAVITYTHFLTNTGNGPDGFDVACHSSRDWDLVCPATVDLPYGQSYPLVVSLTARPGEISGTVDSTVITVTSQASPGLQAVVTDTTVVNFFISGVALEPAEPQFADPNQVVVYEHLVTNQGNATDRFDISHSSSQSWTVTYDSPVTLGREATHTLLISVHVPQALSGTIETTVVTVAARSNPAAYGRVTDTTTVNLVAGVALSSAPGQTLYPGETVTYTHVLTNLGNYTDTFDLNQTSSSGWIAQLLPRRLTLGYDGAGTFRVRVQAPANAVSGTVGHTTIFAFSRIDPNAQASVLDRTTVIGDESLKIYLPVILRDS